MDNLTEVVESELPALTDTKMIKYGEELGREFEAYSKPRQSLETELWPASIRAFMCIRDELPFIPSMKFIDNGMLGESDIRTAIKQARDALLSGTLPTDESWLEAVRMNDEDDDGTLDLVKQFLVAKFQDADIRDTMQVVYDQLLTLGTSAVGLRWETLKSIQRAPKLLHKHLKTLASDIDAEDEQGTKIASKRGSTKFYKTIFDGPLTYPVDMYRLWLDPNADLGGKDRDMSFIYLTLKTMSDLEDAIDPETGEAAYDAEILKDVGEWQYQQWYGMNSHSCEAQKLMGINPGLENMGKFVPVYMFYRQVRKFEDKEVYVDQYWYVARSYQGKEWKVIRVQENPHADGVKPFYVMNCDPWVGTPYGTSLVEKALSAWKAKNIIEAIGLNAKVLTLFPPTYYVGNVLKDDRKPRLMPASNQEIVMRAGVGMDWIKPFPIEAQSVMIGMQEGRYYGEKILSATGVAAAGLATDPTRSMGKDKTATEVRQTSSEGVQSEQVLVDRINDKMLEPLANGMYNLSRQHYVTAQRFVTKDNTGANFSAQIDPEVLNRARDIKVVGRRSLANKANMVNNMLEAMKILANPQAAQVINNLPLILQDVIFKAVAQLGVPIKPEYKMTPEQIFQSDPKIQMAAVQAALQNPEMRQQIAQQLLQSPEGQQMLGQIHQQGHEAGMKNAQQQQQQAKAAQPSPAPAQPVPPQIHIIDNITGGQVPNA